MPVAKMVRMNTTLALVEPESDEGVTSGVEDPELQRVYDDVRREVGGLYEAERRLKNWNRRDRGPALRGEAKIARMKTGRALLAARDLYSARGGDWGAFLKDVGIPPRKALRWMELAQKTDNPESDTAAVMSEPTKAEKLIKRMQRMTSNFLHELKPGFVFEDLKAISNEYRRGADEFDRFIEMARPAQPETAVEVVQPKTAIAVKTVKLNIQREETEPRTVKLTVTHEEPETNEMAHIAAIQEEHEERNNQLRASHTAGRTTRAWTKIPEPLPKMTR
jgi:hypothetical protein